MLYGNRVNVGYGCEILLTASCEPRLQRESTRKLRRGDSRAIRRDSCEETTRGLSRRANKPVINPREKFSASARAKVNKILRSARQLEGASFCLDASRSGIDVSLSVTDYFIWDLEASILDKSEQKVFRRYFN